MRILILTLILLASASLAAQSESHDVPNHAQELQAVPVPAPSAKALEYYHGGLVLWCIGIVESILVPVLFLFTGLSRKMRDLAERLGGNRWFATIAIYFIFFALLYFLIDLPLSYYSGFVREHAFGRSNQTFSKWAGDEGKGLVLEIFLGTLTLWIPYLLLMKSPQRWWLYTGLLAVPFLFFMTMIEPVFVAPLFNDFTAMKDRGLENRILHLADRAGIEGGRVFEVNKSTDTKAINAYVSGIGGTKRIVLWDTAIANLTERELLFVMGHEMGHYVLGHVWKSLLFTSALILATLFGIHYSSGWMLHRFGKRFGFDRLSDVASLPLVLLLGVLFGLFVTPVELAVSRSVEHEADRFGLEITRDNYSAATAFSKFVTDDLSNPTPDAIVIWLRLSHPPIGERIEFANSYRPWVKNEPQTYDHLFKH